MRELMLVVVIFGIIQCRGKEQTVNCSNAVNSCEIKNDFFKIVIPNTCIYEIIKGQAIYRAKIKCDDYELDLIYGFSGYDLPSSPKEYIEKNEWISKIADKIKSNILIKKVIQDSVIDNGYIAVYETNGKLKTYKFEIPDSLMAYNFEFDSTKAALKKIVWNEKFAGIQIENNNYPYDEDGTRLFISLTIVSNKLVSNKLDEVLAIFNSIELFPASGSRI